MKQKFNPCPRCGGSGQMPKGEYLRQLREARGQTIRELADRLGISIQYLCDIELGKRTGTIEIFKGYGL
jgi:transcriptional regulator with XRE-family HTH domain